MYEQIIKLISALSDAEALQNEHVIVALTDFAQGLDDPDYRAHMLGELAVRSASVGEFDRAERLVRLVETVDRSEFLVRVAEIEAQDRHDRRALQLFQEARDAALLHRFPTQQSMALAEVASSLEGMGRKEEAAETWNSAVQLATQAQHRGGTDGPEAAGVLLGAVEACCRGGRLCEARAIADTIVFPSIREKANQVISRAEHG